MAAPAGGAGAEMQGFQGAAVVGAGLYIWCASCILDTTGSVLAQVAPTFFVNNIPPVPGWKWLGPCGAMWDVCLRGQALDPWALQRQMPRKGPSGLVCAPAPNACAEGAKNVGNPPRVRLRLPGERPYPARATRCAGPPSRSPGLGRPCVQERCAHARQCG